MDSTYPLSGNLAGMGLHVFPQNGIDEGLAILLLTLKPIENFPVNTHPWVVKGTKDFQFSPCKGTFVQWRDVGGIDLVVSHSINRRPIGLRFVGF